LPSNFVAVVRIASHCIRCHFASRCEIDSKVRKYKSSGIARRAEEWCGRDAVRRAFLVQRAHALHPVPNHSLPLRTVRTEIPAHVCPVAIVREPRIDACERHARSRAMSMIQSENSWGQAGQRGNEPFPLRSWFSRKCCRTLRELRRKTGIPAVVSNRKNRRCVTRSGEDPNL
jgi:hypothetical protein